MDQSVASVIRVANRLLAVGCLLLLVCAGLLAKIAADTHAMRPRPWSDANPSSAVLVALDAVKKGRVVDGVYSDGSQTVIVGH